MDFGVQVAPSEDPKMLRSSDSCSTIFVIESVASRTRPESAVTSTVGPSPFALTTVPAGTRVISFMGVAVGEILTNFPSDALVLKNPKALTTGDTEDHREIR